MVTISPVAVNTVLPDVLTCLVTYTEQVRSISHEGAEYSIAYSHGKPVLHGETTFLPITATVNIIVATDDNETKTNVFTETFMVAFQGQDIAPSRVCITSVGNTASRNNSQFTVYDSLEIFIA